MNKIATDISECYEFLQVINNLKSTQRYYGNCTSEKCDTVGAHT